MTTAMLGREQYLGVLHCVFLSAKTMSTDITYTHAKIEEDAYATCISCEFHHQMAVRSFSIWVLMNEHKNFHQISGKLKVLCDISFLIITHIYDL